ncbi:MAG: hypothetical protein ACI4U4_02005 [Bacilli bacterium]
MKLNNKGFAITSVLYGLLILFVVFTGTYLSLLGAKKNKLDKITEDIEKKYDFNIPLSENEPIEDTYTAPYTGKYTFDNTCIRYLYKGNVYEKSELCNASTLTTIECHGSGDECE